MDHSSHFAPPFTAILQQKWDEHFGRLHILFVAGAEFFSILGFLNPSGDIDEGGGEQDKGG